MRDEQIRLSIDKMVKADFSKPAISAVDRPIRDEFEEKIWILEKSGNISPEEAEMRLKKHRRASATRTYDNKFNYSFSIPAGIYSIDKYYEQLNNARTVAEVERIVDDFKKKIKKEQKKRWWQ